MQRAHRTLRRSWRADDSTQLHHRLVEVAGAWAIEQRLRSPPRRFPSLGCAKHALDHTLDVAVHDGHRFSESNARDRRRSVTPDTRKLAPLFRGARKDSPALTRDQLRRLVHAS